MVRSSLGEGFGMANREENIPADADTIYRIASMSKAFASMSVLKLQEGGALNLADNLTNTIPTFGLLPRYTNQSLTVRSILAHECNIPGTYYKDAETTVQKTNYYETVLQSHRGRLLHQSAGVHRAVQQQRRDAGRRRGGRRYRHELLPISP
jgi:CubicO group peptidase (beta-lactamase class C family)